VKLRGTHCPARLRLAALFTVTAMAFAAPQQEPAKPAESSEQSLQPAAHELFVTVGKSLIVNSAAAIERISVGYNDVAEATAIGLHEVLVNGKAPGETSLIVWQRDGIKVFFDVTVRPNTSDAKAKLQAIRREMKKQLPGQNIELNVENGAVFLSGTVQDVTSAQRAEAIAATLGKTVNLLYVAVPPSDAQVLLNVKFALIDRIASSQLGINLLSTGAANTVGTITTGQFSPPTVQPATPNNPLKLTLTDALNIFLFRPDLNLGATIKALELQSVFEILAEPNILANDGKQASFLAGGEFPYPILQGGGGGLGTVTIAFRQFGVRLNFVPHLTPRGTIKLEVAPEVSALDYTNGLNFEGFTIPALTVRRVHTEIELRPGQSFAIAGLLDRRLTETMQRVPVLSSIPVFGNLFKSRLKEKDNSELLVIATPELVRPIPAGQPLPSLSFPKQLPDPISKTVRTPGLETTGPVPDTPRASMPLEDLLQSLKAPAVTLGAGSGQSDSVSPGIQSMPGTSQQPTGSAAPADTKPPGS
jgi:pilus assembly protein CpaC